MQIRVVLMLFSSVIWAAWLDDILVVEGKSYADVNRTVKFSLRSRKNQTGHSVTHLVMDKSSMELPDNWNIDIEHRFTEYNGMKSVYLHGLFTVPPPVPDYELFPGIGYYKFHHELAPNFDAASTACIKEGGHLAIVNSLAESEVMRLLWGRYPESENFKHSYAYVGIHDRFKEGEFITIFGKPINSTGFTKWAGPNPDNYNNNENCGSINRLGLLNDVYCAMKGPFICEYDLSWIEG